MRSPWLVAFNLVLVGALFIVGEGVGRQTRTSDKLGFKEALGIGLAQTAALFPGVALGATIRSASFWGSGGTGGAFLFPERPHHDRRRALELVDALGSGIDSRDVLLFMVGSITSGVVGYLAIGFFSITLPGTACSSSPTTGSRWPPWWSCSCCSASGAFDMRRALLVV